ncbi:hypothetical protein BDZ97DRAFT_2075189 [Flammula alnicola]|nr:hypothetical protein BDZ97DRAFT_2075189 [Flammula alnicola]
MTLNIPASLAGPIPGKEYLHLSCNLMNFYFTFDEYTDVSNREEAKKIAYNVMEAFRHRKLCSINAKIAEIPTQLVLREDCQCRRRRYGIERFIADFDAYVI